MNKKFSKNNESFDCLNCGAFVEEHPTTSRDHCNVCLYSLHVDNFPGDRMNECRGLLKPVGLRTKNGKTQIVYRCERCGSIEYCIKSIDDNKEEIIKLGQKTWIDN